MLDFLFNGLALIGLGSPWSRFFFGAATTVSLMLIVKPSISYHEDGSAKSFLSETFLPFWLVSVVVGFVLAVFV